MKKVLFFYFSVFSTLLFAQERIISGTIKDVDTNEPIDGVSISIVGSNMGTVSNSEGAFKITVPEGYTKLSFSHLSYALKEYDVKDNATVEQFLIPKEYQLKEVVINQTPTTALLNNIYATSMEKLLKTNLLSTYYREFVKEGDKYIRFADGILDYYLQANRKNKILESDLYVKQSRIADLRVPKPLEDEPFFQAINPFEIRYAILYTYDFMSLLHNDAQHPKDDYEYNVETKTETNGNSINIITVTPKEGVEKLMLIASITYDPKTKLILDIDVRYSPNHKKYLEVYDFTDYKGKVNDMVVKASFKVDGNKYVMAHYQRRTNLNIKLEESIERNFECITDITVLDYKEGKFKLPKSKWYKKENLFANGNNYTEEFWKKQNILLLTDEEENIINTLNQKSAPNAQSSSENK